MRVTTSIACLRYRYLGFEGSDLGDEKGKAVKDWETISVSNRLFGRIWISPVFFRDPRYGDYPRDSGNLHVFNDSSVDLNSFNVSSYINDPLHEFDFYDLKDVKEQKLDIRIGINIGFRTAYFKVNRDAERIKVEAFGSRNYGSSYLPHPDTERQADGTYWYRDTGSDQQEFD